MDTQNLFVREPQSGIHLLHVTQSAVIETRNQYGFVLRVRSLVRDAVAHFGVPAVSTWTRFARPNIFMVCMVKICVCYETSLYVTRN